MQKYVSPSTSPLPPTHCRWAPPGACNPCAKRHSEPDLKMSGGAPTTHTQLSTWDRDSSHRAPDAWQCGSTHYPAYTPTQAPAGVEGNDSMQTPFPSMTCPLPTVGSSSRGHGGSHPGNGVGSRPQRAILGSQGCGMSQGCSGAWAPSPRTAPTTPSDFLTKHRSKVIIQDNNRRAFHLKYRGSLSAGAGVTVPVLRP